jgi:Uma2 family endonuclease
MALKTRPRKTTDDYMKLAEGTLAELIDGELLMSPSPKKRHQQCAFRLTLLLGRYLEATRVGELYSAPFDVHLPSGDIVQPDVIFVSRNRTDIVKDWIRGAPDLLIEILSPENRERDLFVKRALYERNGVREYWIVDPEAEAIEVLVLSGSMYASHGYFQSDDTLNSPLLADLTIPVRDLMARHDPT